MRASIVKPMSNVAAVIRRVEEVFAHKPFINGTDTVVNQNYQRHIKKSEDPMANEMWPASIKTLFALFSSAARAINTLYAWNFLTQSRTEIVNFKQSNSNNKPVKGLHITISYAESVYSSAQANRINHKLSILSKSMPVEADKRASKSTYIECDGILTAKHWR